VEILLGESLEIRRSAGKAIRIAWDGVAADLATQTRILVAFRLLLSEGVHMRERVHPQNQGLEERLRPESSLRRAPLDRFRRSPACGHPKTLRSCVAGLGPFNVPPKRRQDRQLRFE